MTTASSSDPSTVDFWLHELRRRNWSLYFFGRDRARPELIAAVWHWPYCADVVILRSEGDAIAFRTPTPNGRDMDVLDPEWVNWVYRHTAVWTLRAVLTLADPGSPNALLHLMAAPECCRVPPEQRRPFTFRPTSNSHALQVNTPGGMS
ncbi:hypothetical protein [Alloactinosynnema sp. L-07]|uniref:hypothetical protein n=1 Tax=Alloactinosynnema sp. L-07 TaxID=1653480 RepID=UPI00065F05EA|nr:hypothetical protein [Alloactinosynnema sp. L-07]CRK59362.1 hypothetical protein [Alloactinosynnema sp. L-07]